MIAKLMGGLGNQLFIYAFARQLQSDYGGIIKLIEPDKFPLSINNYRINKNIILKGNRFKDLNYLNFNQKIIYSNYKLMSKYYQIKRRCDFDEYEDMNQSFFNKHNMILRVNGYCDFEVKDINQLFLCGFFQSENYFPNIKDTLLDELVPTDQIDSKAIELIKRIAESNSVCVHIRRGDYLNNPVYSVCDEVYYNTAIMQMRKVLDKPVFFLFSNDKKWLQSHFFGDDYFIVQDDELKDYETLQIMKACNHFIIANSSFSWWAQYLSDFPKKVVIAPSKWYAKGFNYPCDIYQKSWKLVNINW